MFNFLKTIIEFFNSHKIPYMLSGSVALSIYTLPRATRDFDFVVHLQQKDIDDLLARFREGYYCDRDAVKEAIIHHSMFNIIDHTSGFKADFIILKNEPFRKTEFERRLEIEFEGMSVNVVSAEDLLLSKLIWIQELQSAVQMEDIKNLSTKKDLDWTYLDSWIKSLNLNTFDLFKT
jgi:hypothetical protein